MEGNGKPNEIEWEGRVYSIGQIEPEEVVVLVEDRIREMRKPPLEAIVAEYDALAKCLICKGAGKKDGIECGLCKGKGTSLAQQQMQKELLDRAYADLRSSLEAVDVHECYKFINTRDGQEYLLYRMLQKNHPELDLATVRKMILRRDRDDLVRLTNAIQREKNKDLVEAAKAKALEELEKQGA